MFLLDGWSLFSLSRSFSLPLVFLLLSFSLPSFSLFTLPFSLIYFLSISFFSLSHPLSCPLSRPLSLSLQVLNLQMTDGPQGDAQADDTKQHGKPDKTLRFSLCSDNLEGTSEGGPPSCCCRGGRYVYLQGAEQTLLSQSHLQ